MGTSSPGSRMSFGLSRLVSMTRRHFSAGPLWIVNDSGSQYALIMTYRSRSPSDAPRR